MPIVFEPSCPDELKQTNPQEWKEFCGESQIIEEEVKKETVAKVDVQSKFSVAIEEEKEIIK